VSAPTSALIPSSVEGSRCVTAARELRIDARRIVTITKKGSPAVARLRSVDRVAKGSMWTVIAAALAMIVGLALLLSAAG
jgi:hypothetical protein